MLYTMWSTNLQNVNNPVSVSLNANKRQHKSRNQEKHWFLLVANMTVSHSV